ncbi:MAG: hypothetical protein WCR46_06915 [Deltaproteobacteria bacterium]
MNPKVKELAKRIRDVVRDKVFWIWKYVLLEAKRDELLDIFPDIAVEYRFGDSYDIKQLNIEDHEYDAEAMKFSLDRLENGDRVILGFFQGNPIFYIWLMFQTMDIDYRKYIPISFNRVYAYKGFTVQQYRGKHVLAGSYRYISDCMKQGGYDKVIASIDSRNLLSLKSTIHVGYRPIGHICKIQFIKHRFCYMGKHLRHWIER